MAKTKKQLKIEQANMQSDNVEMGAFSTEEMNSDGIQYSGSASVGIDVDPDFTYSFGDLGDMGQLDMFDEMDMRDKYPALNQAWEHYQSILEVCKTKEKEENED